MSDRLIAALVRMLRTAVPPEPPDATMPVPQGHRHQPQLNTPDGLPSRIPVAPAIHPQLDEDVEAAL